jgi:hypothetical protein
MIARLALAMKPVLVCVLAELVRGAVININSCLVSTARMRCSAHIEYRVVPWLAMPVMLLAMLAPLTKILDIWPTSALQAGTSHSLQHLSSPRKNDEKLAQYFLGAQTHSSSATLRSVVAWSLKNC